MKSELYLLKKWAEFHGYKSGFVDPASAAMPPGADPSMAGGAMPPGAMPPGGMPMDPAMMSGAMPPGAMPPMDMPQGAPMMVDPATGAMPVDPAAQQPPADPAAEEDALRQLIRDEVQKALGTGEAGQPAGAAPAAGKKSNKLDDAIAMLKEQNEQQTKLIVAALRQAGIEIPLADMMGIDGSVKKPEPGVSEELNPGQSGTSDGGQAAKIGEYKRAVDNLVKLANVRNVLAKSAFARDFVPFDPVLKDTSYLAGLWR